jgi:hypothetical protein
MIERQKPPLVEASGMMATILRNQTKKNAIYRSKIRKLIGCHEIPMIKSSHQPKMNIWGFHVAIKKQIIY